MSEREPRAPPTVLRFAHARSTRCMSGDRSESQTGIHASPSLPSLKSLTIYETTHGCHEDKNSSVGPASSDTLRPGRTQIALPAVFALHHVLEGHPLDGLQQVMCLLRGRAPICRRPVLRQHRSQLIGFARPPLHGRSECGVGEQGREDMLAARGELAQVWPSPRPQLRVDRGGTRHALVVGKVGHNVDLKRADARWRAARPCHVGRTLTGRGLVP